MLWSMATVSLGGTLADKLEAISRAGFEGVEIFENDLICSDLAPRDVRQMCGNLGLEIIALQPFRDFEGMPQRQRNANFHRAECKFELMQELGTDLLLVCSNISPNSEGYFGRIAEDFHALGELGARHGVKIGYEALAWGRHVNDYRQTWEIVKRCDHANVGLVLDSFHILAKGHPLEPIADIPGERIFLAQLADAPLLEMGVLAWSRHYRCFPGQGQMALEQFAEVLAATGYDGALSLEVFNDEFRSFTTGSIARDGLRSLNYLQDRTSRLKKSGRKMPPAPDVTSIEFLEFAVPTDQRNSFGRQLQQLGFAATGRHRSKNVDLYQQGDINLVVNANESGFAHAYQMLHGISVCAIAFQVDDAAMALKRARQFNCTLHEDQIGPGEKRIPAIRGLEGSLIYLLEREEGGDSWLNDFVPTGQTAGHETGLTRIDHLSQVMAPAQLSSMILFYRSVFGFRLATEWEINDPHGQLKSQAVLSPNGHVRIALNVPVTRNTQAQRFLSKSAGGAVQQIAFASNDLCASLDKMGDGDLKRLEVPENYYADLASRFELDLEFLADIKSRNVFFDRSDKGEFLHSYLNDLNHPFFFELLERRGSYDQFGAMNSTVRIAAQERQVINVRAGLEQ